MLNGVLVTFLVDNQVFDWTPSEIGWLMGIPVLTGAISRLPLGILTDKYGGRPVMTILLLTCSIPMFLLSYCNTYWTFALCSLGFGLTGGAFAVGTAFTSYWYPKKWQGTALGTFGAGNAGAAITTLFAPSMLYKLTANGVNPDGWRDLPRLYALVLILVAVVFYVLVKNKKPEASTKTIKGLLAPLAEIRVWRFGLYYFLVFGMFVAFSQWLVPYFVNVYYLPLVTAGLLVSFFSFPSGVIRILGGWLSDKFGPRKVMYWVLTASVLISLIISIPKMEISTPGNGVSALFEGDVTFVSDSTITVGDHSYAVIHKDRTAEKYDPEEFHILPVKASWQEPVVKVGQHVQKKELLAQGTTRIIFEANVWIFAVLAIIIGIVWGIGKAAVYKHIPDYYPSNVGVVSGTVGLIGGMGGFMGPIIFGYLLESTGLWTTCWMMMFWLSAICLWWMHRVIQRMIRKEAPELARKIE